MSRNCAGFAVFFQLHLNCLLEAAFLAKQVLFFLLQRTQFCSLAGMASQVSYPLFSRIIKTFRSYNNSTLIYNSFLSETISFSFPTQASQSQPPTGKSLYLVNFSSVSPMLKIMKVLLLIWFHGLCGSVFVEIYLDIPMHASQKATDEQFFCNVHGSQRHGILQSFASYIYIFRLVRDSPCVAHRWVTLTHICDKHLAL